MIYTEEDLKQAYAMGYNEAVDDVNAYIDQESMEFSLDESYDEDYSAVEDAIMNETKSWKKDQRDKALTDYYDNKFHFASTSEKGMRDEAKKFGPKQALLRKKVLSKAIDKRVTTHGRSIPHLHPNG